MRGSRAGSSDRWSSRATNRSLSYSRALSSVSAARCPSSARKRTSSPVNADPSGRSTVSAPNVMARTVSGTLTTVAPSRARRSSRRRTGRASSSVSSTVASRGVAEAVAAPGPSTSGRVGQADAARDMDSARSAGIASSVRAATNCNPGPASGERRAGEDLSSVCTKARGPSAGTTRSSRTATASPLASPLAASAVPAAARASARRRWLDSASKSRALSTARAARAARVRASPRSSASKARPGSARPSVSAPRTRPRARSGATTSARVLSLRAASRSCSSPSAHAT